MLIFFLFLKRAKIGISQDVKLLSGHFECSQRNPDQRVGVKDPARNNLVDYDAAIVKWPNELATNFSQPRNLRGAIFTTDGIGG